MVKDMCRFTLQI